MKIIKQISRLYDAILQNAHRLMLVVLCGCLFAISSIKLHCPEPWIESNNAEAINEVLVNLSYSYIAGFVFYLFTVWLPNELLRYKMRQSINVKMRTVVSKYKACLSSVVPLLEHNTFVYSEESVKAAFEKTSLHSQCSLGETGMQSYTVINYIIAQHTTCIGLLDQLLEYKDILDASTLSIIEDLRNPSFQGTLYAFSIQNQKRNKLSLDRPDERIKLAIEVFKQYKKSELLVF